MSVRLFGTLFALGCAALTAISWWHTWPSLSQGRPWTDLGGATASAGPALLQFAVLTSLFALYLGALVRPQFSMTPRTLAFIGLAPGLLLLGMLPANSTDVLFYVAQGRVAVVHGANPYVHLYSEFADEFSPLVPWDLPMPYGPVMLPPLMAAGWLSQYSVVAGLLFLKVVWLLAHLASGAVLFAVLRRWRPGTEGRGLFLFLFNPLVLLELIGNAHNDGVMVLGGLLSVWALQRGRPVASVLLAFLAAMAKIPGVIWGAVAVYLMRRRDWAGLAGGLAVSGGLGLIAVALFFGDPGAAMAMTNSGWYAINSVHVLFIDSAARFGPLAGFQAGFAETYVADRAISALLLLAFGVWRAFRIHDLESLVREVAHLFLAVLIGYTAWFFPWYATWVVPLAAMTASAPLRAALVAYSWSVLLLYAVPGDIGDRPVHQLAEALRIAAAHGTPLALLLAARLSRSERRARSAA